MLSLSELKSKLSQEGTASWLNATELEYFWSFEMKASREEIWVYLSDTSRFNRELGFMPRVQTEREGKQYVSTTMMGQPQEWIEEPWTWLSGQTMASDRIYVRGMAKRVQSVFHIEDAGDHRVVYIYFGWIPASAFWALFLRASAGIVQKKFGEAFVKIDGLVANARKRLDNQLIKSAPPMTEVAKDKLGAHRGALVARGLNTRAVDALVDLIKTADDLEVGQIRVMPLSRRWSLPHQEVLATCLHATRLGLLNISWEVICPHCRGSRFSADSLGAIPENANCEVCALEFATDEPESIEVLFHVHASVRAVPTLLYCAAEPAKKQHIKVQQHVAAGQSLNLDLALKPGIYRARWIGDAREERLEVDSSSAQHDVTIRLAKSEDRSPKVLATDFRLTYANPTFKPGTFILEELWWENQALKPSHVLAMPEFRDLFANEHLSSNVKLFLGEQTILFTDIVGSSKFYAEVGESAPGGIDGRGDPAGPAAAEPAARGRRDRRVAGLDAAHGRATGGAHPVPPASSMPARRAGPVAVGRGPRSPRAIALVDGGAPPTAPSGPYQLQAAIAAVHAEATRPEQTDWRQILLLYGLLEHLSPASPMITLNRIVALAEVEGPAAGLAALDRAGEALQGHYRVTAVRAHLLEASGMPDEARAEYERAARATLSRPERRYLESRAARL